MFRTPELPVSAGAILLDEQGRLLILKPTYKTGWTLPGGMMEDDGESPWDACRREVREETGIEVTSGRLVCVDTRPAKKGTKLGLRLLFHCGTIDAERASAITLQAYEISDHRWVDIPEALELLRPAIRRRVKKCIDAKTTVYLEGGKKVDGVSS